MTQPAPVEGAAFLGLSLSGELGSDSSECPPLGVLPLGSGCGVGSAQWLRWSYWRFLCVIFRTDKTKLRPKPCCKFSLLAPVIQHFAQTMDKNHLKIHFLMSICYSSGSIYIFPWLQCLQFSPSCKKTVERYTRLKMKLMFLLHAP